MFNEEHRKELGELPGDQHESEFPPGSGPHFTHPSKSQNLKRTDVRVPVKLVGNNAQSLDQLPVDEKGRNLLILFFEWVKKFGIKTFRNSSFTTIPFTAETRSGLALAYAEDRNYLIIQNPSVDSVFVDFDKDANITTSIEIVSGGNYEPLVAPRNTINIVGAIGAQPVIIIEGRK